ncbi:MAG: M14 family metallopeptidase, partial [Turicibacter sp.]
MKTTFNYDHYFTYEELTHALTRLAKNYPKIMNLYSICETQDNKQVWAVKLTNIETGSYESKPAFYIDGNHHAGEVTGSMAAMHTIDYLVTNYKENKDVTALLDQFTIYVIPKISPDGSDVYLTTPQKLRSVNRAYPFHELQDGLHLEDMDGDGVIRLMRVPTPYGAWKIDQEDNRLMIKRQPDDCLGEFFNIYPEGFIINYDGLTIQLADELWGLDFNRNYPFGWFPESRQSGAGKYPLSNIENKAVADFVIEHENIGFASTLHTTGGVILYPPGVKPESSANKKDMQMYRAVGKIGTEEMGYECVNIFDAFLTDTVNYSSGAFDDWCYFTQGIPTFTVELWNLKERAGIKPLWPEPLHKTTEVYAKEYLKQIKWIDENLEEQQRFKAWTPIHHPQLGKVEIGGLDFKFTIQNCPPKYLKEEVEKTTRFMLRNVKILPVLTIDNLIATHIKEDIYKIEALISNKGYLPTYICEEAKSLHLDSPVKVSCSGDQLTFINSDCSQEIGHLEGFGGINKDYGYDGITTSRHDPVTKKV